MLDTVDEFEVAALHKWIELISDPDADIPHDLGNNFIRFVKYLTVTGCRQKNHVKQVYSMTESICHSKNVILSESGIQI